MIMKSILDRKYNPNEIESKIYNNWESKGYFEAKNTEKEPFTIILPPPNVTGKLHMGHVLDGTIQDTIIRWKRMSGYEALWMPGMDHAGIATQNVVEKMLAKEGLTKEEIGKEEFVKKVWEWKEEYGGTIEKQLRRLGASLDWSKKRFTMDDVSSKAVRTIFKKLYDDKLIYKAEYIVNWCPRCKTALADDEVEHQEKDSFIWHIRYNIEGTDEYLIVATTRPETMLGDTGVAVNPNDDRYKHLVGKNAILPLVDRKIPIVADSYVDMEFGTGVVKMTPAHDPNDFEVARRCNLEILNVFTEDAKINENGGKYEGYDRFEARNIIVEDLKKLGYLVDIKPHKNSVGECYRCHTVIEPRVSKQWFVDMKTLAKRALEVVRNSEIEIDPKRWEKVYYNWLENIRDWCISRQIWWGHRIPAYYTKTGEMIVAENLELAKQEAIDKYAYVDELYQEEDVLDTWFSSALWPFSTLGWPNDTKELEKFFPTNVLVTGADILFFWVARMIMMSLYATDKIPFKDVLLHGIVRDEIGRKMSKSLGNSPDTIKLLDTYGADAIRFSFLYNTSKGQDIHFSEKMLELGSNFANKVWNASKFVISNLEGFDYNTKYEEINLKIEDKYILTKLNQSIVEIDKYLTNYDLDMAVKSTYEFFKTEFCDWYVEIAKTRVYGNLDENDKKTAQYVLRYVLDRSLKLLHPYMPFVTEEIWQEIRLSSDASSIMIAEFPKYKENEVFVEVINKFDDIKEVIVAIRNIRAEAGVSISKPIEIIIKSTDDNIKMIKENYKILEKLTNVKNIYDSSEKEIPELSGFRLANTIEVFVPLMEFMDKEKELAKLEKEKEKINLEYQRVINKLNNEQFISKAPKVVIDKENKIKEELEEKLEKIEQNMKMFR